MKILLACLNVNDLGGSELYHYELARELHNLKQEVTLFTLRNIDSNSLIRKKLNELGIRQLDKNTSNINENFDIVIASQPEVNSYLLQYTNSPIISIIHSEIRSEVPIFDPKIKHYIVVRESIKNVLRPKIEENNISLIYNPIDQTRYNKENIIKFDKTTGIFVGEVLDSIRFQSIQHLIKNCITQDWDLYLMSKSRYDFNHPNIKYIDQRWDTESIVKKCHFTGGILMGRTTLEGWCCGIPGYMYLINDRGDILGIESKIPKDIVEKCDSKYVAQQHLDLYKKIINEK